MKNSIKSMLILFIMAVTLTSVVNCSHNQEMRKAVKVKNQTWYADKGPLGALKINTMNSEQKEIPKKQWDTINTSDPDTRFGKLCTDPKVVGDINALIGTLCSFYEACEYPEVKKARATLNYMQRVGRARMSEARQIQNETELIHEY